MTSVHYHLLPNCTEPSLEKDYSIHFQGRMTPEEFHQIMDGYEAIFRKASFMKAFWICFIFIILLFPVLIVFLIIGCVRQAKMKRELEEYNRSVNSRMISRGISFRCVSSLKQNGRHAVRTWKIEVDVAQYPMPAFQTVVMPLGQQQFAPQPQYMQPTAYAAPPTYAEAQPVYNENQPLLAPPKEV
eukprot:TRINITY_DN477_c0_g1_i1.p1 TRINITY_DN477_c0_g1~~TRINITY_DN477_c0_g1_i1.p1  ORF type:complete len:186 (+),score=25.59 TRINITY_DN477_c0_g1_i1:78-635(+)